MMYRGFKIRIYPNKKQENLLKDYCYYSHQMWNFLVDKFNGTKPIVGKYNIKDYDAKQFESEFEIKFPKSKNIIHSRIFVSVMMKYCESWKRCYNKIGNAPKFHKYNSNKQSFSIGSYTMDLKKFKVRLPKRQSNKTKIESYIPVSQEYLVKFGILEVINPSYSFIRGKWYLSGTYKININNTTKSNEILGLDWGIKDFYTISDGTKLNYPKTVLRCYERINRLKSIQSNKVKKSNNYRKLQNKLDNAWERFKNLKKDFIEQETSKFSNYNIAIEDLTKSKILGNNKNRRRLQLISPRYLFNLRLQQKCNQKGNILFIVDPYNTSKTCNSCGQIHNLRLKDRILNCDCGIVIDRDLNASYNIKDLGIMEMKRLPVKP